MDISVTEFKQRCLEIIRRVERTGGEVTITRRSRVVAQLLGHGFWLVNHSTGGSRDVVQLMGELRFPPPSLWSESLVSSD